MNDLEAAQVVRNLRDLSGPRPFPEVFDNTMLSTGASCMKKAWWEFIYEIAPAGQNVHLHAGGCFAAGLEAARLAHYRDGVPPPQAMGEGLKKLISMWGDFDSGDATKSLERMMGALEYYFSVWPLATDYLKPLIKNDIARIEFTFAIPIPEVLHPTTGQPIIYAGRTDMLATHTNGTLFIEDDKTTSSLGAQWLRQWDLRSQFTGYVWAAQQYGYPASNVVVRGVSILKTKYDHAEVITTRPQWHLDMWHKQMLRNLRRWIASWQEGYWDMNLADACNAYGGCPFVRLCDTSEPGNWIEGNFIERHWEPLKVVV